MTSSENPNAVAGTDHSDDVDAALSLIGPISETKTGGIQPSYRFDRKVVVVTGGASGIGQAIAQRFLAAGAHVSLWDCNWADMHRDAELLTVDVTDLDSVQRAFGETIARFGQVDVLVHCAGIAGETVPLEQTAPDVWRKVVDVNLNGTYHVCRTVLPQMREARSGRVVIIASLAGKEGTPNASAYSAAKAGVMALAKSLAKELASTGVLINAIAPAAIQTSLLDQMSPEHVQTMISKSPLGRLGTSNEVAEMALWLASDACTFNTGAIFDLSGGRATY
jgi:NAD(P)-dependent dehydrogenase (short-subunit alcohol dehydrogenase family)